MKSIRKRTGTGLGSPSAPPRWFEETFEREYRGLVALSALMTGSNATAEDVVQDAFLALLNRSNVDDPGAYVRQCVVNGSIGKLRRLKREVAGESPKAKSAPDVAHQAADSVVLRSALATLPERQRAAVIMRITMGWSEAETADALNCAPGTVGSLLHRGLGALRHDLADPGFVVTKETGGSPSVVATTKRQEDSR